MPAARDTMDMECLECAKVGSEHKTGRKLTFTLPDDIDFFFLTMKTLQYLAEVARFVFCFNRIL